MRCFLFLTLFFVSFTCYTQDTILNEKPWEEIHWTEIVQGLELFEANAPKKSILGDSKITFIKIDPKYAQFELHTATNETKKAINVEQWQDSFKLNIVFNAAMYDLNHPKKARGFLKNKNHYNNSNIHATFNSVLCFNPYEKSKSSVDIFDVTLHSILELDKKYSCMIQSLRMIDEAGEPVYWKKKAQSCSMLICAMDKEKNFYLIFCRSPYSHNEMIKFLTTFPIKLYNALYLEGGPQTSLCIDILKTDGEQYCLSKVGSYVSETYPTDKNIEFWKLPNIVGITFNSK